MNDIAVLGREEFTLGFALTGIKKIVNVEKNVKESIDKIKQDADSKIIIIDETILAELPLYTREEIVNSVRPVFVTLGTEGSSDTLRKLIKKSIGVDLWREGD